MKICYTCKEYKELEEFHRHKRMADGHLNQCKSCQKLYEQKRRKENPSYFSAYERARSKLPHRLELNKAIGKRYIKNNPMRYKATNLVNNALRDGKLLKLPCFCCGANNTVAHHVSYDLPLDVVWLCQKHHKEIHVNFNL